MAKFPLFGSTFTAIIAIVMGLLVIAYAGALIAVLRIPSIRAAFAGKSLASADERPDYYDDRSKESRSAND